jgi:acyl-CoA thioester hydrolase
MYLKNVEIPELSNSCYIRVRYAETDKMGIVYNGEYLTYFEVSRVEMMRAIGFPYTEMEKQGYELPLVESHVVYLSPAYFDDLLEVQSFLKFESKPVLEIKYNILRGNTTIAKGYTKHSYFNVLTKKPVRPPKVFVDALVQAVENKNRE